MTHASGETKRERRDLTRQERRERVEASRKKQRVKRQALLAVGAALLLSIVALVVWMAFGAREAVGRSVPLEGATHIDEGTPTNYQSVPPTSGPHYPITAPYGVSDRPIDPGYFV